MPTSPFIVALKVAAAINMATEPDRSWYVPEINPGATEVAASQPSRGGERPETAASPKEGMTR